MWYAGGEGLRIFERLRCTRFGAKTVIGLLLSGVAFGTASAEESAPFPVEAGEVYLGAGFGKQRFAAPTFKHHQLFKDDSAFTTSGDITLVDPQGYLVDHRTRTYDYVPEIHAGYAFKEDKWGGHLRLEASVRGWKRDATGFFAMRTPAQDGYFVEDNATPPNMVETNLSAAYLAIDGTDNPDGTQGGYLFSGQITDVDYDYSEKSLGVDVVAAYDNRIGGWVFSRAVGFTYQRLEQDILHTFTTPLFLGAPGVGANNSSTYDYDLVTNNFGLRFFYSAGYELLKTLSLFTVGNARIFYSHTDLRGFQDGICLSTCDLVGLTAFDRGTRTLDSSEGGFAWDARVGVGASIRIFIFRVGIEGGEAFTGGVPTPRDRLGVVKVGRSAGSGWYARGQASLIF